MDPAFAALQVDVERARARLPMPLAPLADVVWNLAWSWLPGGASLFRDVDADLWERCGHNARGVLEGVGDYRLAELADDPVFIQRANELAATMSDYMARPADPEADRVRERYRGDLVAYFSAEFGVHESLPVYAGGLGILAGDHLKSASDLGLPLVGVGLRYRQGYFHQALDSTGWQTEYYRDTEFGLLPTGLVLKPDGTPQTVTVPFRGRRVVLQIWAVQVGRVPLILLDSNRDDNDPVDRWITGHLYGGDRDTRLAQEMVLGIGGVRALRLLGYRPAVFHMNEGHAAFLSLELIREALDRGEPWDQALSGTRSQVVFTTHTPVPAGHDVFHPDQLSAFMSDYFGEFREGARELPRARLLGLGRKYAEDAHEGFNMTHLAIHTARSTNGVSALHGQVSREMFHWLWPDCPKEEAPIGHVTNGVHAETWIAPILAELLDRYLGREWRLRQADPAVWKGVDRIPDQELWDVHCRLKQRMIYYARGRARQHRAATGEKPGFIAAADQTLDPAALTIGFARRVATYKRLSLLLHDLDRALALINLPGRPVQVVLAGKAHPGDSEAKRLLQQVFAIRYDPRVLRRAVYLVDYNVEVARQMVQGVDVWLNLPRRPLEASGTSGMKAALNGVLNCSILDGWWAEAYNGENGWAVGKPTEYQDTARQDADDAESLYATLENDIVPAFFTRDGDDVPSRWIAMMKEDLKSIGPVFNTHRMVGEYARNIYAS